MTAFELINYMIPPMNVTDTTLQAIEIMEELRIDQLPVIEKGKFMGLISEEILQEEQNTEKPIGEYELEARECIVKTNQHFYDIIKSASDFGVQVVAVLDNDQNYVGMITVEDTITAFAQTAAIQSPGGTIVLSLYQRDYSLSEISRLIESEDAKILSSSIITDNMDPLKIKLTLKINRLDLSHIVATLERFGYKIIARYQEKEYQSAEKERYGLLLKYLNI